MSITLAYMSRKSASLSLGANMGHEGGSTNRIFAEHSSVRKLGSQNPTERDQLLIRTIQIWHVIIPSRVMKVEAWISILSPRPSGCWSGF